MKVKQVLQTARKSTANRGKNLSLLLRSTVWEVEDSDEETSITPLITPKVEIKDECETDSDEDTTGSGYETGSLTPKSPEYFSDEPTEEIIEILEDSNDAPISLDSVLIRQERMRHQLNKMKNYRKKLRDTFMRGDLSLPTAMQFFHRADSNLLHVSY